MLELFVRFDGDMHGYSRSGREPLEFDWDVIEGLLGRLVIVRSGMATASFCSVVRAELVAMASDERVRLRLWELAGERVLATGGLLSNISLQRP